MIYSLRTPKSGDFRLRIHHLLKPYYELAQLGFRVERQKSLPVVYKDITLDAGYRIDLLINDLVIVELKAIDKLAPIHSAQLLSYLRLSEKKVGLLINFNVKMLKDGIKRIAN